MSLPSYVIFGIPSMPSMKCCSDYNMIEVQMRGVVKVSGPDGENVALKPNMMSKLLDQSK